MKKVTTWILIANGSEARAYAASGKDTTLEEVDGMEFKSDLRPAREIMADRQGRAFDRVGGQRHAMEYHSDPTDVIQSEFADELCEALSRAQARAAYDRLVIVAPPAMLAKIRKVLPREVRDSVYADLDKDYTRQPVKKLSALLARHELIG